MQTQVTAYSKWQAELMAAGGPEPELSFWRSQLAPLPKMGGLAALPIDHPRPKVRWQVMHRTLVPRVCMVSEPTQDTALVL